MNVNLDTESFEIGRAARPGTATPSRPTPSPDRGHPATPRTATANLIFAHLDVEDRRGGFRQCRSPKSTCATWGGCTWRSEGVSYVWRWGMSALGSIAHLNLRVLDQTCRRAVRCTCDYRRAPSSKVPMKSRCARLGEGRMVSAEGGRSRLRRVSSSCGGQNPH